MNSVKQLLLGILTWGLLAACAETEKGRDFADFLFVGGAIYTLDEAQPWAEAVAVTGNLISYVGSAEGAIDLAGPDTRTIELGGKMVLPGFIDSHSHIFNGASSAQSVNLSLADTPDKLAAALQELRDANPGDGVVYARGWQNHLFPADGPRKGLLDGVFGDRAVILVSVDGHSTWFSSAALELAGVSE
ncbi:MAG: amidohydrolase family protein, partial [Woeseia sp.]